MKKYFNFMLFTVAALLFTGCSNEDEIAGGTTGQLGKITFAIPSSGNVTYTVTANTNENTLTDLYIYMFDSGVLESVFRPADITLGGSGAARTATIDVTGKTGGRTFYFVGNGANKSDELAGVIEGTTTEADFNNLISNKQTALITATSTVGLLMSSSKTVANIENVTDKTVNLRRRVARFDVSNVTNDGTADNQTGTNFTIENILVSNANLRGYLFPTGTGKTIETGSLPKIVFTGLPNANTGLTESVFYLYPTSLESSKTIISIEGTINGQKKIYTIPAPDVTAINANARYTLKAKRVVEVEWELEFAPWDEGTTVEAGPEANSFTLSGLTVANGDGILDVANSSYDVSQATTASMLKFTTNSYEQRGTTSTITYEYADASEFGISVIITTPPITLTYAGASYEQKYEVDVPVQTGNKVPVKATITISSVAKPQDKEQITIFSIPRYNGTAYKPVLFGGKYWAPVNVGATETDATTLNEASMGRVFQWGRNNTGWVTKSGLGSELEPTAQSGGPIIYNDATGTYLNNYIIATDTPYDWLTPQNDALWSGDNSQGPCPNGWRVPTSEELALIKGAYLANNFSANRLAIPGDIAGKTLYLPAAGNILSSTGTSIFQGTHGYYWSSSVSGIYAYRLVFCNDENTLSIAGNSRAYAYSVRCIQK